MLNKKKLLALTMLLLMVLSLHGESQTFAEIRKLADSGKYLDAINSINDLKKTNDSPELIDLKVEITIEGFAQSISHRLFAFTNLKPGENIMDIRRDGGSFSMVVGDLREEIDQYIAKYPGNFHVYKAAGDFYTDVLLRYGDQLEDLDFPDLYNLIVENYEKSYDLGNRSVMNIASIGEYSLRLGDYEKTIRFYEMALKEDPENAGYNYNISIACQSVEEYETALVYSLKAIEEYDDPEYKADSYHINAFQKKALGRYDEALIYYKKALEINPDLFYSQADVTELLLYLDRAEEAGKNVRTFISADFRDFQKIQKLLSIYFDYDRVDDISKILTDMLGDTADNIDKGTLYYHLALIQNSIGENPKGSLLKARESYLKDLGEDEDIIKHIDSFLEQIQ